MSNPTIKTELEKFYQEQLDAQRGMLSSAIDELVIKNEALEQALQKIELRNKELSKISYRTFHDMREPMISLQGLVMLLGYEIESETADNLLKQINTTIGRLNDFSLSLAVYTEMIQKDFVSQPIDFDILINDLNTKLERKEGYKSVKTKIIFKSSISSNNFKFDFRRLLLILEIIAGNCIRYRDIEKSKCTCNIQLNLTQKGLNIVVKDNGMGIAEEAKPKLLEMFYRASSLSTGSGLGLYIANNIIQESKGKITIESKENVGTKVTVFLPSF